MALSAIDSKDRPALQKMRRILFPEIIEQLEPELEKYYTNKEKHQENGPNLKLEFFQAFKASASYEMI